MEQYEVNDSFQSLNEDLVPLNSGKVLVFLEFASIVS